MAKEKKNLSKLNPEETHSVAGGKIFAGPEYNMYYYYVPTPTKSRSGKYYVQGHGTVAQMQARERAAGRSDEIVRFKTAAEARAAADREGRVLAWANGDVSAFLN